MKSNTLSKITRNMNKIEFKLKKHSPEILITAGVIGTVVSTVLACKATTKLSEILEKSNSEIESIHKVSENPEKYTTEVYTEDDAKKDLTIAYTHRIANVVKLYVPSVILGTTSIGCILASNNILKKRNIALAAAYTVIDKSFKEYRSRVVDRFGERTDYELKYDIKAKEIERTISDDEGIEKVISETVDIVESKFGYSDYAKFFMEGNPYWEKDPEYNLLFLKNQQRIANDKLQRNGILFLNDVYEMLGIEPTRAGQIVGWIYNEDCPNGDNYVDFGIYDVSKPAHAEFVNGYEKSILLDFNVDGNVWDFM